MGGQGDVTGVMAAAAEVVDLGLRACEAYARPDLSARLQAVRRRLTDPTLHVVVVGEFKQGKSSLVNALVGADVCPVDDDVATAVPTFVRHGAQPEARIRYADGAAEPIAVHDLPAWVTEHDAVGTVIAPAGTVIAPAGRVTVPETTEPAGGAPRPTAVDVRVPSRLPADGLVLVDTPGIGGLGSAYAAASLAAASMADALVFVTDASQELTRSEVDFLEQARRLTGTVVLALTKTDFYPSWRVIAERNRAHLHGDLDLPVLPVSSTLRAQALATDDAALDDESGCPELARFLREVVAGDASGRVERDAAREVLAVCDQLRGGFESERAALADPARAEQVVAELTAVRERVEALRTSAARWSQTLSDGVSDLGADVDHDLRSRIRQVVQEADAAIDASDPADTWPEMASWLEARMGHELLANYLLVRSRADALATRVGRHFADALDTAPDHVAVPEASDVLAEARVDEKVDLSRMNVGMQAMVALKNAYGGAIVFIMLGSLVGVTLAPVAAGIGLVMGRRGLREEKRKQRAARQTQARNAVRRYCDQVGFQAGKDLRDALSRIQRQLRDHYTAVAGELERSNTEALERASEVVRRTQAERERRLADVDAELQRLSRLREQAVALVRPAAPTHGGADEP